MTPRDAYYFYIGLWIGGIVGGVLGAGALFAILVLEGMLH